MMGPQPAADLPPELGLAIPAQAFTVLARPLDLGKVAVVGLEDVVVLREDGADVRIRTETPLLLATLNVIDGRDYDVWSVNADAEYLEEGDVLDVVLAPLVDVVGQT